MRELGQILLLFAGRREDLIGHDSHGLEWLVLMGADDVVTAKINIRWRQKEIQLLSPLRLDGRIWCQDESRTFKIGNQLQPDNSFAGAGRSDDMDFSFALLQFVIDQTKDFFLIASQWMSKR